MNTLHDSSVFSPADGERLKAFYSQFSTVKFQKNEIIYLEDTEPENAFAVRTGFVRSFTYSETDEERSISFVLKDELFPLAWLFSKTKTPLFNYIAHTDCELYKISTDRFNEFLATEDSLAKILLLHSMNDNVTKMLKIQALEQGTAERKILHTFNYFCISYGHQILRNLVKINVPLTQKDIASFTGLTRETTTGIITKLKRMNLISVKKRFYTVDIVHLRKLLELPNEAPTLNGEQIA